MKNKTYGVLSIIAFCVLISLLLISICQNIKKYTRGQTNIAKTYIVQPGDTLWSIAKKYTDGDPRQLIFDIEKINNIGPVIFPGQKLAIPIEQVYKEFATTRE